MSSWWGFQGLTHPRAPPPSPIRIPNAPPCRESWIHHWAILCTELWLLQWGLCRAGELWLAACIISWYPNLAYGLEVWVGAWWERVKLLLSLWEFFLFSQHWGKAGEVSYANKFHSSHCTPLTHCPNLHRHLGLILAHFTSIYPDKLAYFDIMPV